MKIKYVLYFVLFLSINSGRYTGLDVFAQQPIIDSLLNLLKIQKEDTNKVISLNKLSQEYIKIGEYNSCLKYSNKAYELASSVPIGSKRGWPRGVSTAYNNIGIIYYSQGNYPKALDYYSKALKIDEESGDKKRIALAYVRMGLVYFNQGDYPKSLENYFLGLKICEAQGNKESIALILGNIGPVYKKQGDYPKALDYYFKALKMSEELRNKNGIAIQLGNIGLVYQEQGDYPKALDYDFKALKKFEELGDKNKIALLLGNIGIIFENVGNYTKAEDYFFKALKIDEELGNKYGKAIDLGNISSLYTKIGRFKEAEHLLKKAVAIVETIGSLNVLEQLEESLSHLYDTTGRHKLALIHYKKAMVAKDSLFNEDKNKEITRKEMTYEFEKKELASKAEQDKKDLMALAESKRQLLLLWFIMAIAVAVSAIAGLVFRSLRITKRQKQIIGIQKEKVEIQNEEITKQKGIVEEKNHEIASSISYSKRIQRSFLTSTSIIERHLPDHFILYKPKDVVSGDFYWMHQRGDYSYFCVADCTGHGIPGAFMSLIGMGVLNEIVNSKNIYDTNDILNELRRIVILAVNPEGATEEGQDGMDLVYLRFHLPSKELQYSAANNSFYICRKGELLEFKPDKMPVGRFGEYEKPFTQHTIQLEDDDIIYAITDGYADQFGGPKGKKFKYKQLEDILTTNSNRAMALQSEALELAFSEWKGDLEQVDDVTVIGIRI